MAGVMGTTRRIAGGGGLELSVYECGKSAGPGILFIHGFCQSHLAWSHQFESVLAEEFKLVALDLRGHGMSDKPPGPDNYTKGQFWADDIAAVIARLDLQKPNLVAWSYGGYVLCDYLQRYGDSELSGVVFVSAGVRRGMESAQGLARPGIIDLLPGLMSTDLDENIAATREFVINCTSAPPSQGDLEQTLAYNMMTPPQVREAMFSRALDFFPVLSTVKVPTLVIHGTKDEVIDLAMAELILAAVPGAQKSFYEGLGHAPFRENPERFNLELENFVRSC